MQWTAIYIWMDHAVLTVTMHQRDTGFCSFHRCNRKDLICQFCNIKCLVCWGYDAYGNDVIGLSGCGPTCLSMIVIGLTKNQEATPDKLADYATEHGYYEQNSGTKWSFMDEVAAVYGVQGYYIYLSKDNMQEELSQGHPLVCAMRSGDFTSQGHFIVIAGMEGAASTVTFSRRASRLIAL